MCERVVVFVDIVASWAFVCLLFVRLFFSFFFFFFQAEDGRRGIGVTGVQTCALPISVDPGACATAGTVHVLTPPRKPRRSRRNWVVGSERGPCPRWRRRPGRPHTRVRGDRSRVPT